MTAILGYARVSTSGQDLDAQLAALNAAGVDTDRVFTNKISGSANTGRPGLAAMLDYARAGDTVVVTAIDRVGRSVAEVTRTIAEHSERRILLRALREGVDTATPTGRAFAAIMATLAELELGRERRAASRESRRTRQLPATKPYKLTADRQGQLRRLAAIGEPVRERPAPSGSGGRQRIAIYRRRSSQTPLRPGWYRLAVGTKAERRAASNSVFAYHEARLADLVEYIAEAVEQLPRRRDRRLRRR